MNTISTDLSILNNTSNGNNDYTSPYEDITSKSINNIFKYYNELNTYKEHMNSNDDVCTPMECVKKMIDYMPNELWKREEIRILDPCCGNGNFGAYCKTKTNHNNIWYNEINPIRYTICKSLLNPSNIGNYDFFDMKDNFTGKWDMIMANPPYSGGGNKNKSLSNLFIEKSIDLLNENGYLCFITPNNWMTYNNNNTTLKKLLNEGSFLVIDNDVKKHFPGIGSSFTIFIWQKGIFNNKTYIVNNFLIKDIQKKVIIPNNLQFIPLYISQTILDIIPKLVIDKRNNFNYRCDLHNFTKKDYLSDIQDNYFQYRTIHTARKTRYACIKQDIYDKWNIIIPLSTYYIPYLENKTNVTQSVGYISFEKKEDAIKYLKIITEPHFKLIIHLTRYGNFNNLMILKHLNFEGIYKFTKKEQKEIERLVTEIKY